MGPADTPNILFLMTDQQRADTLPQYGNRIIATPAFDRIASSGVVMDRFFTPTAICTPARASLFTGTLPFRHGLLVNPERAGGARDEIREEDPNFARVLLDAGYNVGHAGKWHIGRERGPGHYGIDGEHLPGALNPFSHASYVRWLDENGYPPVKVIDGVFGTAANGSGRGHLIAGRLQQPLEATVEAFILGQAEKMLDRYAQEWKEQGTPFMLTASWFGPHLPYLIPNEFFDMYDPDLVELPESFNETFDGKPEIQRRYSEYWSCDAFSAAEWKKLVAIYWGYVTMIDRCIGRLLDLLEDRGLESSTTVIFTPDHGEFTGAHRLNDKGPAMYDDIYRIPVVIRAPGLQPGRRNEFASLVDLTATIVDIAGLPPLEPSDGRSLLPVLRDETPSDWPDEFVAEFHGHHFAYSQRMIRDERFKLVFNPESVNELYDLQLDPHELHNVYKVPHYRGHRDDLEVRLYRELIRRGDPAYTWMSYMSEVGGHRAADVDGIADQL